MQNPFLLPLMFSLVLDLARLDKIHSIFCCQAPEQDFYAPLLLPSLDFHCLHAPFLCLSSLRSFLLNHVGLLLSIFLLNRWFLRAEVLFN